ncbi:TetR/AcrR family transcriptional regulator [Rhizobium sp. CSW-27]|uniref:TetR/AcrR family transcriptional regulator n=1 Tax=Rhizobium sp. CSW-27 TaxID=2839985 RepID=UPI001C02912A|nr:TetR/AcrR family transcriptional regulator [Rhizobium sp. CSW-27]MBT9371299.1 TetR/AcrR family transcriptional regulator [Rhizobium sp. CSW-27]
MEPGFPVHPDKRGSAKPRLVLQAARSSFLDHGYDRTSMDMIAQQAGVSKATVYAHFDSKEALLYGLVAEEFEVDGPPPLWDRDTPVTDIESALRAIARKFTAVFLSDKKLAFHRLIVTNASRFPEIAEIFMNGGPRRNQAEMRAFLEQGIRDGFLRIDNLDLAAKQFLSLVQGDLPLNWALSMKPPAQADYDALIEGGVAVFLAAYGTSSSSRKAEPAGA